jgi:hypothetical protein
MLARMFRVRWLFSILLMAIAVRAQSPATSAPIEPNGAARPANSDGTYQALRGSLPSGDGFTVKDLTLEREGGVFHFTRSRPGSSWPRASASV